MDEFVGPVPPIRGFWSKLTPMEKFNVAFGLFGVAAALATGAWTVLSMTKAIATLEDRGKELTQRIDELNQRLDEEVRQDRSRAAKLQACAELGRLIAEYSHKDDSVTTNRLMGQARAEQCPGY